MKLDRLFIQFIFVCLAGLTAIHKLTLPFPPNWFVKKFEQSIIQQIPFGIEISFGIITLFELIICVFFTLGILKKEFQEANKNTFSLLGINFALGLFLMLFFGSFLVEDYDNGFKDFIYFILSLWVKKNYFKNDT